MNISYSWLKDYVDFNLSPDELAAALTSIGLECGGIETVESVRGGLRGIVIGKVLTCVEHPNSDHLHITTVDLGDKVEQIVCGAPNVAAGQTVVVATVGTTLYDGDNQFQIKKSKIRGVESMGMICAEDEIGIGTSHDGIIVINQDIKPGTPAAEYYNLKDDYVLEVDLTPNRIDAASHFGVARDLSAWLAAHQQEAELRRPSADAFAVDAPAEKGVDVQVVDADGSPRYCGVTIEGVTVAESPEWLKDRLNAIGLHPINNIVDITNYILHSLGQPLHCFDRAKIKGDTVVVRTCPQGTKFTTLDGVERTLDAADLMICNAEEPMCMAGVFGGLDSGVTAETKSVFLESAYFNPTRVRKTARRHGLNTDSSFRFERGIDPNTTLYVLKIAALLVKELAGGRIVGEVRDVCSQTFPPFEVDLSTQYMDNLIGTHIDDAKVDAILRALEIETVSRDGDIRKLLVPTYRVDVQRPCDVVEDVLRIYGYNNIAIPEELHASLAFKTKTDAADDLRRTVAEQLTAAGFNEILNNSLTAEVYYADLQQYPASHCVKLLNPLSQDLNVMRQTLLFGGLESLAHNINRKNKDLALYETGNVYFLNPEAESTTEKPLAPYSESARLALWMTGDVRRANWTSPAENATFFHLKANVANIFARLGITDREVAITRGDNELFAASLNIATKSGKQLGVMGVVAKALTHKCDIKQEVYFAELNWNELCKLALKKKVTFADLPKTQPVKRDLALLINSNITMAEIETVVRESERKLLRSVELFDVYEGKNLAEGKKSYAISLTLQDDEKTLNDKAIDAVMQKIITNLTKRLGAELR
jgi:phenylalanyl-tRNA synthetase beta chain